MALRAIKTMDDGTTVVRDDTDGASFVLKPGVWDQLFGLPPSEQRTRVEQEVIAARADPTGGRNELDEQARETAQNAATGEAHESQEVDR